MRIALQPLQTWPTRIANSVYRRYGCSCEGVTIWSTRFSAFVNTATHKKCLNFFLRGVLPLQSNWILLSCDCIFDFTAIRILCENSNSSSVPGAHQRATEPRCSPPRE